MSLSDVAARLRQLVGQDGMLPLDPATFAQPEFASFHAALASVLATVGADRLQVSGAQVALTTAVTVDGQTALFGTKPGMIRLEVAGADQLTATLTFTAPQGWGFADGFPGLPPSHKHLSANPGLVGLGTSALYDLSLASAALTATSGSPDLAFTGSLADASYFTFLATALNLPAQPPLTGTIRLNGAALATPDLAVGGGLTTLQIGDLLDLTQVGLRARIVQEDPGTGGALTRVDLDATIEAGTQDPVPIRLSAPFYGLAGVLELTADFGDVGLLIGRGVHAFAELLGLDMGSFSLPSPLDVVERFALYSMTCVITTDPPGVQRVVLTAGPGQVWPIATGIEVDDLTIGWAIAFPFDSDARWMSASIAGTLTLGTVEPKLEFDVLASSDGGFTASGDLTRPMTLQQIATTINGAPVIGLPQLEVLVVSVSASTSGDFEVLVSLGNWPVGSVGDTPIVLYEVLASLQRQGGATGGQFLTVLGVGTARLLLTAQLPMSSQAPAGWVFDGGTQPGTALDIGDLLAELADTFGIHEVPTPIKSLQLTALNLHYETAASRFTFTCTGSLAIAETPVSATVTIGVEPAKGGHEATFGGQITVGGLEFGLVFDAAGSGIDIITASYTPSGPPAAAVSLHDLVAGVSATAAELVPAGLDLGLDSATLSYDITNSVLALEAQSAGYGTVVLAALKSPGWSFFFGLGIDRVIGLSDIPIIGPDLAEVASVSVSKIQVLASSPLDPATTTRINKALATLNLPSGYPQAAEGPSGMTLTMVFDAGGQDTPLAVAAPPAPAPGPGPGPGPAPPPGPSDQTAWVTLQKSFGPVAFQKVGIRYRDSVLYFLMDASVSAGGLTIAMMGLGVGSPLATFEPTFTIDGLAITYADGPVEISGALSGTIDPVSFSGELVLQTGQLQIGALGGYCQVAGQPSLFLYAVLGYPVGGPAFFFVTGLAAGFGFNRSLVLPPAGRVDSFPLVQWAQGAGSPPPMDTSAAGDAVTKVIGELSSAGVMAPSAGDYWLAVGVRFTSFELVQSFALLTVMAGPQFEVALLGTSTVQLPASPVPPAPPVLPVALAELELAATFIPSEGLVQVSGQLTPQSFVLSPDCHLTGGFALATWFSGANEGQFVLTLGGYSPVFDPPSYYPAVPRLGLNWQVTPELTITGDLYFALTSSAVMAGGGLSAVWQSGPVRAWFDIEADFLLAFEPFHYYISAGIQLGASVTINLGFTSFPIGIQVGVTLEIWGPDFSGQATVDLSIISFTISFGASEKDVRATIGWDDFVTKLIPSAPAPAPVSAAPGTQVKATAEVSAAGPPPAVVQIAVQGGLVKRLSDADGQLNWVVNGDQLQLVTQSAIPAKDHSFSPNVTLAPGAPAPNTNFGVGPAGVDSAGLTSTHTIEITAAEGSAFQAGPVLRNVPAALWRPHSAFDGNGVPEGVDPVNSTTVDGVLTGYTITPAASPPDHTLPIGIEDLEYTIAGPAGAFTWTDATAPQADPFAVQTVWGTIGAPGTAAVRQQLAAAIAAAGWPVPARMDVSELATQAAYDLAADPALRLLGEQR